MKTIEEEIIDYLKNNDMYYVEEYDEDGFPIDDEAHELIGDMTNAELCDIITESMEDIAKVQRKIDVNKACEVYKSQCKKSNVCDREWLCFGCPRLDNFRKAMEGNYED